MSEKRNDQNTPDINEDKEPLSWKDVEVYVAQRQQAMEEGRDPDEIQDGPTWEEVQSFVAAHENRQSAQKSEEGNSPSPKKESIFSFGKDVDELGEEARRAIVASMLPGGNLRPLFESKHCLLCNCSQPNPRTLYAVTDMGHKEPEGKKTSALGLKVKTKVGSLVPLQIASCPQCRHNFRVASNLRLLLSIALVVLSLLAISFDPVETALLGVHPMVPVILFVAMIPVSWLIGTFASRSYIKRKSAETHFDIEEIPFVQQMVDLGWFQLYGKQDVSRLIFSKERLKGNWFTN